MKPTINGTDPWELELSLQNLGRELKRIGAGDSLGFLLTDIENSAKHTKLIAPPTDPQELKLILDELNLFQRSLNRLTSTGPKLVGKIRQRVSQLSPDARKFVNIELTRRLNRKVDIETEDWSRSTERDALLWAAGKCREWVRSEPGPSIQPELHQFCLDVILIYQHVTGKSPGVGGEGTDKGTPFEQLWLASLRLTQPYATLLGAREIFRSASGRR